MNFEKLTKTLLSRCFIFDFDDTICHTDSTIKIFDRCGKFVKELTSKEFANYHLKDNECFINDLSYDDFYGINIDTVKPIKRICNKIKKLNNDIIFILTARHPQCTNDVHEVILKLTGKYLDKRNIYCVGNEITNSIAEVKRKYILEFLKSFDEIYFYDDNYNNIENLKDLKNIKTFHVK